MDYTTTDQINLSVQPQAVEIISGANLNSHTELVGLASLPIFYSTGINITKNWQFMKLQRSLNAIHYNIHLVPKTLTNLNTTE